MIVNAGSPRHHIDVVVFASPLVRVGRWRCPADHPQFHDSGPSSDALFAFPREGVWIEHDGLTFVADPNTVTYYNRSLLPPPPVSTEATMRVVGRGGGGDRETLAATSGGARSPLSVL